MFSSHKLMNLLRSGSLPILNFKFIIGARPLSGKVSARYVLGKKSDQQKFQFFIRGLSQLHQEYESGPNSTGNFVLMRGLPFEATTADIIKFFRPLNIEPVEVIIEKNKWGRANGFASVKFQSHDDALKSLRNHRSYMGRRYIELSLDTRSPSHPLQTDPSASTLDYPTKSRRVILKGVPYEATVNDIIQFFAPLNIKPSSVEIRYSHLNLPSGICDCIFESHEDASTALKNHKAYIGKRWIEVFPASASRPLNSGEDLTRNSGGV